MPIIKGNGISQKILAQVQALNDLGCETTLCHFKTNNGYCAAYLDDSEFCSIGGKIWAQFSFFFFYFKLARLIKIKHYNLLYLRYDRNANIALIWFLRHIKGRCIRVMEIPTYPYDGENSDGSLYRRCKFYQEKYYRAKFCDCLERIITFVDEKYIFGVKTLKISNAVDDKAIRLINSTRKEGTVRMIAVANINFWHGYDRLIMGIKDYYEKVGKGMIMIKLTIVGDGNNEIKEKLIELVKNCKLEEDVKFLGNTSGEALNTLFDKADFAIGCLGCHRKNVVTVKSLKNVEYAMRGIPFIYSEVNDDFDDMPFVLKAKPDDSAINIEEIIEFVSNLKLKPAEIRSMVNHLTWRCQMSKVLGLV